MNRLSSLVCVFAWMVGLTGCEAGTTGASSAPSDTVSGQDSAGAFDAAALDDSTDSLAGLDSAGDTSAAEDAETAGDMAGDAAAGDVSSDVIPSVEQSTKSGAYTITLTGPTTLKAGKKATYVATVTDSKGATVPGLTLKITFIHVKMGHGGSSVPKATDNGDGTYAISGIQPSMAGDWALQISISGDVATFDILVGG